MTSFSASSPCLLEWRPSRLLRGAVVLLGMLAALSLWHSNLPRPLAVAGAVLALAEGRRLARRLRHQPPFEFRWAGPGHPAELNFPDGSRVLHAVRVDFRGPIARVSGRDPAGRMQHWQWWPDTLPAASRRSLRLASSRSARAIPASPYPS